MSLLLVSLISAVRSTRIEHNILLSVQLMDKTSECCSENTPSKDSFLPKSVVLGSLRTWLVYTSQPLLNLGVATWQFLPMDY